MVCYVDKYEDVVAQNTFTFKISERTVETTIFSPPAGGKEYKPSYLERPLLCMICIADSGVPDNHRTFRIY